MKKAALNHMPIIQLKKIKVLNRIISNTIDDSFELLDHQLNKKQAEKIIQRENFN